MKTLPEYNDIYSQTDKCVSVLEEEMHSQYRYGSLLDFSMEKKMPLIVVPDLHARRYFFQDILDYKLPIDFIDGGCTTREALDGGAVRVVCVGDALHSESRARDRWRRAFEEMMSAVRDGPAMKEEMAEGLGLLIDIMKMKCKYPALFHFLKGNHENIRNRRGGGDFPFCKFADEGEMTREFMCAVYGEDILYLIGCFEDALPLVASTHNCVISHAEPERAFTREEIINAREDDEAVSALTWTANDEAKEGSVREIMKVLGCKGVYITGHRPVAGKYCKRQNGDLVQIHNPDTEQIALVRTEGKFDPERDIVVLGAHR